MIVSPPGSCGPKRAQTKVHWIALLLLLSWAFPAEAAAARFHISPSPDMLFGETLRITLEGLAPGTEVDVQAERSMRPSWPPGSAPRFFRSHARFVADAQGQVDLASAAPLAGTYSEPDPMGLFWSMEATSAPPKADDPEQVRLTASVDGSVVASAAVRLRNGSADVRVEPVPDFPGAIFASRPGAGRRPAIIVLGGSEGGAGTAHAVAPRFASKGYAVFGLPYYSPWEEGRTREIEALPYSFADIPIDRIDQVRDWLSRRTDVDPERIGIWGGSKGAEFALLAAVHFPWVRSVAALAPSDVVWEGWGHGVTAGAVASFSFRGRSLPFVPYDYGRADGGVKAFMDDGRRAHPDRAAAARIPVERFRGDLLVAAGRQDTMWESAHMAQNIAERRAEAGLETVLLIFPEGGHGLAGDPWEPKGSGDAAAAEARIYQRTWQETFAFFDRTLRPNRQPATE